MAKPGSMSIAFVMRASIQGNRGILNNGKRVHGPADTRHGWLWIQPQFQQESSRRLNHADKR
jgi:hypothetical protein